MRYDLTREPWPLHLRLQLDNPLSVRREWTDLRTNPWLSEYTTEEERRRQTERLLQMRAQHMA